MKNVLSHLYKRAVAEQIVQTNLAEYIKLPKLNETEQTPFSEIEIKKLWDGYRDGISFVGYILLMIYSGMMPGELLECTTDMVDLEAQQIVGAGKKTKKRKVTPLVIADFMVPVVSKLCDDSKSKIGKLVCMNKDKFYEEYYAALYAIFPFLSPLTRPSFSAHSRSSALQSPGSWAANCSRYVFIMLVLSSLHPAGARPRSSRGFLRIPQLGNM